MISLYPHFKKLQVVRKRKSALLHKQQGAFPWWKCLDYRKVSIEKRCILMPCAYYRGIFRTFKPFYQFFVNKKTPTFLLASFCNLLDRCYYRGIFKHFKPFCKLFLQRKRPALLLGFPLKYIFLEGAMDKSILPLWLCHYYRGIFSHCKQYSKIFQKEKCPAERKALSLELIKK